MEDILFCKDLHDPLENKGEKPEAKKDEEWRKMNRKTIGLIRQCIGHEFDDEMQALLLLSSLPESWETLVVSLSNSVPNGKLTTSMVMDALFNEETRRREMSSTNQRRWRSQARGRTVRCFYCDQEGHIKRDCPKYKAQDQSSDTAATTVMAVDESEVLLAASDNGKSDWVLDSGSAYHLCRDREVFSTYVACEGRIWMANNTASRVVGRGSVRFRMADGRSVTLTEVRHVPNLWKNLISIGMLDSKGCSFEASGGTLRVSKGNKEILWGKKTRGLYRLEGSVQTGGATIRHGSSGISKENGQGKQLLHKGTQSKRRVQDVHREAQRKETKSILRSCTAKGAGRRDGATTTLKVTYFATHPGGVCGAPQWGGARHLGEKVQALWCGGAGTSVWRCIHFGGKWSSLLMRLGISDAVLQSYGGAGSEVVRKDNLKTSDYPPVDWRGRLLSPAHLDESKPTWMSPSPVAKPKPDWSSYGVSM
ncbi:transcription regulator [Actinidia rufa]|uniref:Transcription regulator n=1 Tax=Actinidia rufa TaxID=165716 RepID=A0A7J0DP15_9ERIC|nr:transcription regulator [Actinidia rufa]